MKGQTKNNTMEINLPKVLVEQSQPKQPTHESPTANVSSLEGNLSGCEKKLSNSKVREFLMKWSLVVRKTPKFLLPRG